MNMPNDSSHITSSHIVDCLLTLPLPTSQHKVGDVSRVLSASDTQITLEWHLPCADLPALATQLGQQLKNVLPASQTLPTLELNLRLEQYQIANARKAASAKLPPPKALPGVKNVIAVASGKGGVGKSTTAINLALALQQEGARVGLLDADIFGPSQSILSGVAADTRPEVLDDKMFRPIAAHGLQIMSMGFLITEQTPAVWRGPMASGALTQMMNQTAWDDLDVLIVDMPPGTGDIQLTLSQSCPLTAAVIVTTPQDIALLDAIKGIEMFRKVNVPVLGIVENMSTHTCSHCGHTEAIFGEGGGERMAADYQVPLLGRLPLDIRIRQHADAGQPTVVADPDSSAAQQYRQIALGMAIALCQLEVERAIPNVVSIR